MRQKAETIFKTPLGWVGVAVREKGIVRIVLPREEKRSVQKELEHPSPQPSPQRGEGGNEIKLSREGRGRVKMLEKAVKLLREYFSGKSVSFDLPIDMGYYTPFQQAVWKACAHIPFGEKRSYGWIAQRIDRPRASRAVGQAMGANPIPILIP